MFDIRGGRLIKNPLRSFSLLRNFSKTIGLRILSAKWAKRRYRLVLASSVAALVYPSTAAAYIDPGSGSVIVSTILGLVAAGTYTVKKYFYKIKRFFRKDEGAQNNSNEDDSNEI